MLELYASWHDMLLDGYEAGLSARISGSAALICGLGGSGAVGDFLASLARIYGSSGPIVVHKDFGLPPLPQRASVIAISYSGNTLETISCLKEAIAAGLEAVAISSGGTLEAVAKEAGIAWVGVRGGLLPRAAFPLMLGAALAVTAGFVKVGEEELLEAYGALRAGAVDDAEPIASALAAGDVAVVGACGRLGALADRWRQELSENSKMVAKSEIYPEAAHNDIVAWQQPQGARLSFLAIMSEERPCDKIMDFVRAKYSQRGPVATLSLGRPALASLMRGAQLAGFASVLIARLRRVKPEETPIIAEYKRILGG